MARSIVQYQKNFKKQFLTLKILPEKTQRKKKSKKKKRKKAFLSTPSSCTNKAWKLVFIFPSKLGVSGFIGKGSPDHKPDCICTRPQSQPLFLPQILVPTSLHYSLMSFVASFPPEQALSLHQKPIQAVIVLMTSGNSSDSSWSAEAASPVNAAFF